jgi:hypothetical protein
MTVRLQIAFVTGRSDPASCALAPQQRAFLDALAGERRVLVDTNFPYRSGDRAFVATPLWRASLRNAGDYLRSRRDAFRETHGPAVATLLANAHHTVLLAGSCGLEILANLRLPAALLQRTSVFAFGPVARSHPACRVRVVQGTRDWMSRLFVRRADHRPRCGHLDYLRCAAVQQDCRAFVASVEAAELP